MKQNLIDNLRYQRRQVVYHNAQEDAAGIGSLRKYHREEASMASSRCTDAINSLNAEMVTGIDPEDWQNRGGQIDAFLA